LYAFIAFVIVFVVLMIVHAIRARSQWWRVLIRRVIVLLSVFSCIYMLFVSMWGFNYARQPLAKTLGLDASPATFAELETTCSALTDRAVALRSQTGEDADGVFLPAKSRADIMTLPRAAYQAAADESGVRFLGGSYGPIKPVLYSEGLSYANITGVYFPFTGEANANAGAPDLLFAATCLHEAAHQRGFAREDEANFLAYYTATYTDDTDVQYSATMLALIHAMNKLHAENREAYYEIRSRYSDGMSRDLALNAQHWQQYEGPVAETSVAVNNTFLKANQQQDGVKSYGRMVDLLIGMWRAGDL